jgi:hypothetical protein
MLQGNETKRRDKMKKIKSPCCFDWRGCLVKEGDAVLVREPFPRTTVLKIGIVEKVRTADVTGGFEVKLVKGKWYHSPLKLANK